MCGGREGSSSQNCTGGSSTIDSAWLWVILTVGLWLGLMIFVWVMRTCTHRQRRHRFLNKVIRPVLEKMGVKVIWGDGEDRHSPPVRVYCTPSSDQPPSYDMVMASINITSVREAIPAVPSPMEPLRPPSYDEVAARMSLRGSTSESKDLSSVLQMENNVSVSRTIRL